MARQHLCQWPAGYEATHTRQMTRHVVRGRLRQMLWYKKFNCAGFASRVTRNQNSNTGIEAKDERW